MGTGIVLCCRGVHGNDRAHLPQVQGESRYRDGAVVGRAGNEHPAVRTVWARLDGGHTGRSSGVSQMRECAPAIGRAIGIWCRLPALRRVRASSRRAARQGQRADLNWLTVSSAGLFRKACRSDGTIKRPLHHVLVPAPWKYGSLHRHAAPSGGGLELVHFRGHHVRNSHTRHARSVAQPLPQTDVNALHRGDHGSL